MRELQQLLQKARDNYGEFGLERLTNEDSVYKFVEAITSVSMFSSKKIIFYEGLPSLEDDYQKIFIDYLKDENIANEVVFYYRGSPDKRKKLFKVLAEVAECKEYKSFDYWHKNDLLKVLVDYEKSKGFFLELSAAEELIELLGMNRWALENSLERIETYLLPEKVITKDIVCSLVNSDEREVLDIQKAFRLKSKKLFTFLDEIRNDEDAMKFLNILTSHVKFCLILKSFKDESQVASKVGRSPFYVKNLLKELSSWKWKDLKELLSALFNLDYQKKRGEAQVREGLWVIFSELMLK